jgi:hypothetical protein
MHEWWDIHKCTDMDPDSRNMCFLYWPKMFLKSENTVYVQHPTEAPFPKLARAQMSIIIHYSSQYQRNV